MSLLPSLATLVSAACLAAAVALPAGPLGGAAARAESGFGMGQVARWFRFDWSAESETERTRRIAGYLYNDYGRPASDVQVVVEVLDGAGAVVARRYAWVPGQVPPASRSFFSVTGLPLAPAYRVGVHAYTFLEADGWQ